MLIPINRLIGVPIMSLQTGTQLASVGEPIVDPRKLRIVAFRVKGTQLSHRESVLHPEDIRELSDIGVIVDSDDVLMPLSDLVRLEEIIGFGFKLDGIRVEDEQAKFLGKVDGYAVDQETLYIEQLYTKPSLMRSIVTTGLTIHRQQITSINNRRIVVSEPTIRDREPVERVHGPSFINPFRSPAPNQPES